MTYSLDGISFTVVLFGTNGAGELYFKTYTSIVAKRKESTKKLSNMIPEISFSNNFLLKGECTVTFCGTFQRSLDDSWHFLINNEMIYVSGDKITRELWRD